MTSRIRLAFAQINPTVGDLAGNRARIERRLDEARALGVSAILFPELVLSGYPPEDLLRNGEFLAETEAELRRLIPQSRSLLVALGVPLVREGALRNAAVLLQDGRWVDTYAKGTLPNYGVFDEKRYFRPGLRCPIYEWGRHPFGLNICEDLWTPGGAPRMQARGGAHWLWNLSSSPYHADKGREREALLRHRARTLGVAVAYCNLVGGQDELVFDGESLFVDASGVVRARGPQFREALVVVDVEEPWLEAASGSGGGSAASRDEAPPVGFGDERSLGPDGSRFLEPGDERLIEPDDDPFFEPEAEPIDELESQFFVETVPLDPVGSAADAGPLPEIAAAHRGIEARLAPEAEVFSALKLGLSDYMGKNGFRRVVLGLSGGIDSALTAVIAADALGREAVLGVSMPSRYNRQETRDDAALVARNLGIGFREIPIAPIFTAFLESLAPAFAGAPPDVTEENIQARVRGTILMALSNKTGALVLTTGNKSELAVGYCTLYGDMVGGFAVLKDVPKTLVYRLAEYRNSLGAVIPEATIARAPSAELRDDQKDSDTLPPYELLDEIVRARLETEEEPRALVERGLDPRWVETVYRWIDASEYKRRQAPPGIKITPRAFGRDRRYPITNRYRWGSAERG